MQRTAASRCTLVGYRRGYTTLTGTPCEAAQFRSKTDTSLHHCNLHWKTIRRLTGWRLMMACLFKLFEHCSNHVYILIGDASCHCPLFYKEVTRTEARAQLRMMMVLVVMRILPLVHQPTEKLRSFAQKSSIATWTTYGRCAMTRRTAVFGIVVVVHGLFTLTSLLLAY